MFIYSKNKETLIECEKLIHSRRYYLESNYRCQKWAEIQKHNLKDEYALPVDELALELIHIPEGVELIDKLPKDFYPPIEELE
jgi:hypothetical protein